MAARRMPISSTTMMAVCRLLMRGLSPKLSRTSLPSSTACVNRVSMRATSSGCRQSPAKLANCVFSASCCTTSPGVKNDVYFVSLIMISIFRICKNTLFSVNPSSKVPYILCGVLFYHLQYAKRVEQIICSTPSC